MEPDRAATARRIIDANRYLTLASADADGEPWASPVWFAHAGYREFIWVSRPSARHSRNLAARPRIAFVVFDSTVAEGAAEAVYVEARAEPVPEAERERGIEICNHRVEAGGWPIAAEDVTPPAELRLYRAIAEAHFLLGEHDQRLAVSPG